MQCQIAQSQTGKVFFISLSLDFRKSINTSLTPTHRHRPQSNESQIVTWSHLNRVQRSWTSHHRPFSLLPLSCQCKPRPPDHRLPHSPSPNTLDLLRSKTVPDGTEFISAVVSLPRPGISSQHPLNRLMCVTPQAMYALCFPLINVNPLLASRDVPQSIH